MAEPVLPASRTAKSAAPAAVTFDLHDVDEPDDVRIAAEAVARAGVRATFFVPSGLLALGRFHDALRALPGLGHEVASHSHTHERDEFFALRGGGSGLEFLERSRDLHAEFFRQAPTAFRAPFWGRIAPPAARRLAELGYRADSSATPQRLPWFGSSPFDRGWLFAPRAPFELAPGLLEVPTSTLFVPAVSQAFLLLRSSGSRALLDLLRLEASVTRDRVLVTAFHVEDFHADSPRHRRRPRRLRAVDFLPLPTGGVGLRRFVLERDPRRITAICSEVVRRIARLGPGPLTAIADTWRAERNGKSGDRGPAAAAGESRRRSS